MESAILLFSLLFIIAGGIRLFNWQQIKKTWNPVQGTVVAFNHQGSSRDIPTRVYAVIDRREDKLKVRDFYSPIIRYIYEKQAYEIVLNLRTPEAFAYDIGDNVMLYVHPQNAGRVEIDSSMVKVTHPTILMVIGGLGVIASAIINMVGN